MATVTPVLTRRRVSSSLLVFFFAVVVAVVLGMVVALQAEERRKQRRDLSNLRQPARWQIQQQQQEAISSSPPVPSPVTTEEENNDSGLPLEEDEEQELPPSPLLSSGGRTPRLRYSHNNTVPRRDAVALYTRFCPNFSWVFRRGCGKGGIAPNLLGLCDREHVLRKARIKRDDGRRLLSFVYGNATVGGILYNRNLRIVCPYDAPPEGLCQVQNALCLPQPPSSPTPPTPSGPTTAPIPNPTRAPIAQNPPTFAPVTRMPTLAPVTPPTFAPVTPATLAPATRMPTPLPTPTRPDRNCTSCLTGQTWTCPFTSQCGCNLGNCLASPAVCSCRTMDPLVWSAQNEGTIELCQDPVNNATIGYRLSGQDSCHLAAIMIRVRPGNSYRLTIQNNSTQPTNLHTHGLHISGDGNADNPQRSVSPGSCLRYYWDVPNDHMGGTHWMHSHHRTVGNIQVRGGAVAMFIVEDTPDLLENVDATSKPAIERWLSNELLLLVSRTLVGYRGNGLAVVRYNLTVGEWYRLRVVGVDMDGNSWRLRMPSGCTVLPVAHDGVWRFAVPGPAPPSSTNEFRMTPAGRLDVAIRCNRVASSLSITAIPDPTTNMLSANVATLSVRSGTTSGSSPFTSTNGTWAPKRPFYLQDLVGAGNPDKRYNLTISTSSINGNNFAKNPVALETLQYGSLQEWTVINAADPHSFHQHVHHFQVVNCPGFHSGEFYDTIQPNTSTPCIIRTRLTGYSGNLFLHCHTIIHSEMGAAALFNVTEGGVVNPDTDMDEFVC